MKLLVVSYNCFSNQNANGQTIKAICSAFDYEELAQIYFCAEKNSDAFCKEYYRVTDKDVIKSLFKTKKEQSQNNAVQPIGISENLKKKNYDFRYRWARELLWKLAPWGRRKLSKWVGKIKPDAILYMVGDNIFMDRIVYKLSSKFNLPIILYNCEAFRLVDVKTRGFLESKYYKKSHRFYKKVLKRTNFVIYNCDELRKCYEEKYGTKPSEVIYNSSVFESDDYQAKDTEKLNFVYFGNLGVGRVQSLCEFAQGMSEVCPKSTLNVYGVVKSDDDKVFLDQIQNVKYHGAVPPEDLKEIKNSADVLVHVESFDPLIVDKLKYAFSTKIAQYLCAGRCMISYAPLGTLSTRYLIEEQCSFVATNKEELKNVLVKCKEKNERIEMARKAKITALKNHDKKLTQKKVKEGIIKAINNR